MDSVVSKNRDWFDTEAAAAAYADRALFASEVELFGRYFHTGDQVLDLACGAGRTTIELARRGCQVKGYDIAPTMIAFAHSRAPKLEFLVGSYDQLAEADESYDRVLISYNGLDYAHPESMRTRALAEVWRVLRTGGILIFSSHNLKALHIAPTYCRSWKRLAWRWRNGWSAFRECAYLPDFGSVTFYASPEYVLRSAAEVGFTYVEMRGARALANPTLNRLLSPTIYYVFRKR